MTPDIPADSIVEPTTQNTQQVQYSPVAISALRSTNLSPTDSVIPVLRGFVVCSKANTMLIVDPTGICIVKHQRQQWDNLEGVSIHFNGGVTVSSNTNFWPTVTVPPSATMKRCRLPETSIVPFLTTEPSAKQQVEGMSMLLHVEPKNNQGSRQPAFICTDQLGQQFQLTPYNDIPQQRISAGFYYVINIRKSTSRNAGNRLYFYADSVNGAQFFNVPNAFAMVPADQRRRIDLPQARLITAINQAFERIDGSLLFNIENATVDGQITMTQPSTTQGGKRFQRVNFYLGTGGNTAMLTIFNEEQMIPFTTTKFSATFLKQSVFQGQFNFQATESTEIVVHNSVPVPQHTTVNMPDATTPRLLNSDELNEYD
jgi:hypothetical protein